jgi:hypothetical protein
MKCKSPENRIISGAKVLSAYMLNVLESGTWTCTISQDQKELQFDIKIQVLGKRCPFLQPHPYLDAPTLPLLYVGWAQTPRAEI